MKTYIKIIALTLTAVFTSCSDVIDVAVQTAPERLTIEASINWEKDTTGNKQVVLLSTSTPYFDTTTNTSVTGASVSIVNNNSAQEYIFTDQNDGRYTTTEFIPELNNSYTLTVVYNGETYTATETMISVTEITEITQSTENGFDDEALELNIFFNDPPEEDNYYLIKIKERGDLLPILFDFDDEFTNGNEISLFYEKDNEDSDNENFIPGDIVDVELIGISKAYYNYIRILIEQQEGAGPFGTTPVPLKGNCINNSNTENYANGYFRLTQVDRKSHTFE